MTDCTPGDTCEQLPGHILTSILPLLPPYTSTACVTAEAINQRTLERADHGTHIDLNEWTNWRQRMHERCRQNQKFSGQLCDCHCHGGEAE